MGPILHAAPLTFYTDACIVASFYRATTLAPLRVVSAKSSPAQMIHGAIFVSQKAIAPLIGKYQCPVPRSSLRGLARYVELQAWVSCTTKVDLF